MAYTGKLSWETLRTFNSATLTGSYQAFGVALTQEPFKLKMINNSTSTVTVSIDNATDIDVAPAGSFWLYDECIYGNAGNMPTLPIGTQIYIKGTAGVGSIYLVNQYIIKVST